MFIQSTKELIKWADAPCVSKSPLKRFFHGFCRVVFITANEFTKNELSLRASALTFTIMLSLVPTLALSTAVVKGLGGGNQLRKFVYNYVETIDKNTSPQIETRKENNESPPTAQENSDFSQHLYSAVDKIFAYVDKTNFATLGTFGIVGMVLTVVIVLSNIEMAMNRIWNVKNGRSAMRKIADYLAFVVLGPIALIGLASSAVSKSDALLSKFTALLPIVWMQALILKLIPLLLLCMPLYVIYLFFPNTKVKTIPALIGALFAGFFWFEAQNIYITLQVGVSRYNAIYGSFATLPLFLTWIYVGLIFVLLGAQVAYAFQNKEIYCLLDANEKPSLRLSLAYDLLDYIEKCFTNKEHSSLADFRNNYPNHSLTLTKEITADLVAADLIHRTDKNGSLKPSIPIEQIDQTKIISAILGSTFSNTEGGIRSSQTLQAASLSHAPSGK